MCIMKLKLKQICSKKKNNFMHEYKDGDKFTKLWNLMIPIFITDNKISTATDDVC